MSALILFLILFVLSIVQSVIGVGLLVFGTPTLLLLNYSFTETLSIVLPASICISFMQVRDSKKSETNFRKEFNLYCLPFVILGLVLVLKLPNKFNLSVHIGSMLLLSGSIRLFSHLRLFFSKFVLKFRKSYLMLMGLIHGLTNMGGGLLTLFSSSIHNGDKDKTRSGVAYGYLLMGIIQYGLLISLNFYLLNWSALAYMLIAIFAYIFFGKKLYLKTHENLFQKIITLMILIYGIILVLK
ncbi:MAG: sulfite exporter TauE/SafE family protein [Bacteriovoracaceae bacterium]|nr:sulfite exporter TauE/SafE family protein [Bacteriovoracaceae bacterium]